MHTNATLFIGREEEVKELQNLQNSRQAELVTIMGRRRIGKTYLAKYAYKQSFDFHFTGIREADKNIMLRAFASKLTEMFRVRKEIQTPANWIEAFQQLKQCLLASTNTRKKIVFLDEFPWINSHRSGFLQAFEYFWNDWAVDQNIIIIICGSSTSWMVKHVLNNKGGLHNRVTKYIKLAPFTLKETEHFFKAKKIELPRYEISKVYMAIGGVPYYLNEVKSGESAIQSIDRILFDTKSTLKNEFSNLYQALFDDYFKYETVVKSLSLKKKGLTRLEIIRATKISNGGGLTKILSDLEECSFVQTYQPFGKEKKDTLYRLIDEYSVFYYQFQPQKNKKGSMIKISNTPIFTTWLGFAFESLCLKHVEKIKDALKITGIYTQESSFVSVGVKNEEGLQIDLLIDRSDNSINLCEMKFYNTEFELTKKQAELLRIRRELFRAKTQTKKHLINTLVTTYGLKQNIHSIGLIDNTVVLDDLFV